MRKFFLAAALALSPIAAHAEQYLGPTGSQGVAAGFGYQGALVGYFPTVPMANAFNQARRLSLVGAPVAATPSFDAARRVKGWTIGRTFYPMAIGPVPIPYGIYVRSSGSGAPMSSGTWVSQGNGTSSFVPSGCTSQGC